MNRLQLAGMTAARCAVVWFVAIAACALAALGWAGSAWAANDSAVVLDASGSPIVAASVGADSDSTVSVSKDADAATLPACSFGISDFTRYNKGTNKEVGGSYIGYRYPMFAQDAFEVITTKDCLVIYVPAEVATAAGVDIADASFQSDFLSLYQAIDKASSMGGQTYERLQLPAYFTSSPQVTIGDYTYDFGKKVDDSYYATITLAGSEDGSAGGLYAATGKIARAEDVQVVAAASGFDAISEFFQKLDWSPLWVSLRTTGVAILVIFILGLLAAWLTLRVSNRVKGVLDTVFTIPMVLPPTVCGFLLLMLFGNASPTGKFFIETLGLDLVFTWPAAVIACIVVGFPMMYRTVRGAFENIDANMLDAARTLGWGEGRIFLRIMMPLAWPSIAAGTVLAFARAMGEFGCTLFFAGNYVGITQTIPIAIYFDWMGGKTDVAIFWVIVVILISFLVILFINIYSSRTQRYRKRLGE